MTSFKGKTFFAKAKKGYIPKTAFDALSTNLSKITMRLTKKGMFATVADSDIVKYAHTLWNIEWPRKNFDIYRCTKEVTVTFNVKQLREMLRNVKKKDSMTFYIEKNTAKNPKAQNTLLILIQPEGARSGGPARKAETIRVNICYVVNAEIPWIQETYFDENNIEKSAYHHPMIIEATDFQKIKKLLRRATLLLELQKSNYISFDAGDPDILSAKQEYGEKTLEPESSGDEENNDDEEYEQDRDSEEAEGIEEDEEDEDDEEEDEEEDEEDEEEGENVNAEGEYSIDDESNNEEYEEYPDMYIREFKMSLFSPFIKLPGLTTKLEFWAPKFDQYPLKISMSCTSGSYYLGDITIFVKDLRQIALDDEQKSQEALMTSTPTKKVSKKTKK